MSRRPRVCPLGFDNNTCYLPSAYCPNYLYCEYQTLAWSLPYIFDSENNALIVTNGSPKCYRLVRHKDNEFSEGLYGECYVHSFVDIIRAAWQDAGWWPAVYNKNFICPTDSNDYDPRLDPDYDPIPF